MIDQFPEWPTNAKVSDINIWVDNGYGLGLLYINIMLRNDPAPTLKLVFCVDCRLHGLDLDSLGVALP
jgi:hypothetical protein